MNLERLDHFARRHHGLVSLTAAAGLGVSRSAWYRAIDAGLLERLYPGVARLYGAPVTFAQRVLAAVWASGPGALASHRSSAGAWGVERPADDPIDVILPHRTRHSLPEGVVIHRPRDRADLRPFMRDRIPTTSPLRMLVDLGAVDPSGVEAALTSLVSRKVVSPAAVRAALYRHSRRGRHGVVALRLALERHLGELPVDSELEARMDALLRAHGLPRATFHAVVEGFEADFLIDGTRIILECDGWGYHGLDRDQFEFDRHRDAVLLAAGYITVRFTWRKVVDEPHTVARQIREVVERWHPELLVEPVWG